ncbi:methyltransferase domain-containing protein [Candidatus Saccharibacteria bacterium]|nr:methyltransferase domain-containing protein [Candidatus Saccharibacteria bacterium]
MAIIQKGTSGPDYTDRLEYLEHKKWKDLLDVQRPYRWNIHSLKPGITLDVGCGIGRNLKHLAVGSVGIDHNKHSIAKVVNSGLVGFVPKGFAKSNYAKKGGFDSMLLAHVIEHLDKKDTLKIIRDYLPYIRHGGKVIIICPQKKGFASDKTHVTFYNTKAISKLLTGLGLKIIKKKSFPFPEKVGDFFTYNEYIVVGIKL